MKSCAHLVLAGTWKDNQLPVLTADPHMVEGLLSIALPLANAALNSVLASWQLASTAVAIDSAWLSAPKPQTPGTDASASKAGRIAKS